MAFTGILLNNNPDQHHPFSTSQTFSTESLTTESTSNLFVVFLFLMQLAKALELDRCLKTLVRPGEFQLCYSIFKFTQVGPRRFRMHVGKKRVSMQRLGPACDLGTASDHFEATAERLQTSLKSFEGSV
ncbi:hypothetical protein DFH08DRAFT_824580 [Mycena albidolilacea]|uniref:Uncharacterized protein n=1 Tax=Mycena albidolilacea TaxID=1033008 RepID=A0AAD7EAD5_9AGAR|nr:hypothetical protein DFH08DRAFT_824580 [Mycena albidolilacea]